MGVLENLRNVDPVLTELARGYTNEAYVSDVLLPVASVEKEAGLVPQHGKEAFKIYNTERALRAPSNVVRPEARTTIPFELTEHDLAYPVDNREEEEDVFDRSVHATTTAVEAVKLRVEKIAADLLQNGSNYAGNTTALTSHAKFSDHTVDAVDPAYTVDVASEVVRGKIGKKPNTMVIGPATFNALKFHPVILEKIKYSMKGILTLELLREIFDVEKLVVGKAVYSNDAGVSSDVWGDVTILAWVPPGAPGGNRSVYEPSFGYTLRKKGRPVVDSFRSVDGKVTYYRYTDLLVPKILGAEAGYLITDCV